MKKPKKVELPKEIARIKPPYDAKGVQLLLSFWRDRNRQMRVKALFKIVAAPAAEMENSLVKALDDRSSLIRYTSVEALGTIATESAARHMIRMLKDRNGLVRVQAAEELGYLKHPMALNPLLSCLGDKSRIVRSFAAFSLACLRGAGEEVRRELESVFLNDRSPQVKQSASAGLFWLGDDAKLDYVLAGLQSKNQTFAVGLRTCCSKSQEIAILEGYDWLY
jgi:HEAT repeat protein